MATAKRRKWLGDYLRKTADDMELRDWTVVLMHHQPDNPNHQACCRSVYGTKELQVWVRDDFFERSLEDIRITVVHELLHAHLNPIRDHFDAAATNLGEIYGVLMSSATVRLEEAIYSLTAFIAPGMPLPKSKPPEDR